MFQNPGWFNILLHVPHESSESTAYVSHGYPPHHAIQPSIQPTVTTAITQLTTLQGVTNSILLDRWTQQITLHIHVCCHSQQLAGMSIAIATEAYTDSIRITVCGTTQSHNAVPPCASYTYCCKEILSLGCALILYHTTMVTVYGKPVLKLWAVKQLTAYCGVRSF